MKGFLLTLLAIIISAIFYPLGILYAMFKPKRGDYWYSVAESIDQLGNTVMAPLFNQWMLRDAVYGKLTQRSYKFGNIDETVSSVLGKNKERGTLTKSGRWLYRLLEKIDKNHSKNAIEPNP